MRSPHDHIYRLPPPIGSARAWRFRLLRATALFALIAGIGFSIETQRVAAALGYAPALGEPYGRELERLFRAHYPLLDRWYSPIDGVRWLVRFDQPSAGAGLRLLFADERVTLTAICVLAALLSAAFFAVISHRARPGQPGRRREESHGSAHFADERELRQAGLVGNDSGMYCARLKVRGVDEFLRDASDRCVLVVGPQGSAKTVGSAVPTLLSDSSVSTCAFDIKRELHELTAGWAKRAGKCVIRWDPFDASGTAARYNFLDFIRLDTLHDVDDTRLLAHHLCDPHGIVYRDNSSSNMAFWTLNAANMVTAAALHVLYDPTIRRKDVRGIADYLADGAFADIASIFADMEQAIHDPEGRRGWVDDRGKPTKTHPEVARLAREMARKDPRELSGVYSTLMSRLGEYRSPVVAANTERSDFAMEDLFNGDRPAALYVTIAPGRLVAARPLLQLFFAQLTSAVVDQHLTRGDGPPAANHKYELRLVLDEAYQLGRIAIMDVLAYLRSYRARALFLFQDLAQVYEIFGDSESITTACRTKVFFTPSKVETAKEISEALGTQTVTWEERVVSRGRVEYQPHRTGQPLLSPDQVRMLSDDDALVLVDGHAPIFGSKLRYWQMPKICDRAGLLPPERSDVISRRGPPTPAAAHVSASPNLPEAPPEPAVRRVAPPVAK